MTNTTNSKESYTRDNDDHGSDKWNFGEFFDGETEMRIEKGKKNNKTDKVNKVRGKE